MSLLFIALCRLSFAQDDERAPWGPAELPELPATGEDAPLTEDREAPNIDGRDLPTNEPLLLVPRAVLAPIYVVVRYAIYPPIRAVAIWSEKNNVPIKIIDTFTVFDNEYRLRIIPTTLIDFGFRPSVGLYAELRGNNAPHSVSTLQFAYGGTNWTAFRFSESLALTKHGLDGESGYAGSKLTGSFLFLERPDHMFFGIDELAGSQRHRFYRHQIGGKLEGHMNFPSWVDIDLGVAAERNRFDGSDYRDSDDVSIDSGFNVDALPGYDGYTLVRGDFAVSLDTRNARPNEGSGARLDIAQGVGQDVEHGGDALLWSSAEIGAFADVSGVNHTFGLSQYVAMATPSGQSEVPFTELVTLGGADHMRGFFDGRFRGGSAVVSNLQYNWPVWVYTDATLFAELGGVFGPTLSDVDINAMSASFGTGVRTSSIRETSFQALIAFGSTPLADAFAIDTVRVVFGTNRGF